MPQEVQAGTILMSQWPEIFDRETFDLESEPYRGQWSVVKGLDGFALDRKIRAAGWHFFFIASQVKAMFPGAPRAEKIKNALTRILSKVSEQHYNSLEVTGIVSKHFLGVPYVAISAHPRHLQQTCYLYGAEARRSSAAAAAQNCKSPSRILRQISRDNGAALPSVAD
jgi:hypothetical protein